LHLFSFIHFLITFSRLLSSDNIFFYSCSPKKKQWWAPSNSKLGYSIDYLHNRDGIYQLKSTPWKHEFDFSLTIRMSNGNLYSFVIIICVERKYRNYCIIFTSGCRKKIVQ
jgi:hypothetical protein